MQSLKLGKTLLPTGKQNTSLCVSVCLALSLLQVKLQSCSHCLYHCAQAFWTWLATFVAAVVGVAFFSCLCKTEFWLVLATHFACHNFQWEKRSRHTHTHTWGTHTFKVCCVLTFWLRVVSCDVHDVLHAYVQQKPQQRGPPQQQHRQRTLRTLLLCVEMGKRQMHFHVERNLENPIANAISAKLVLLLLLLILLLILLMLFVVLLLLSLWWHHTLLRHFPCQWLCCSGGCGCNLSAAKTAGTVYSPHFNRM